MTVIEQDARAAVDALPDAEHLAGSSVLVTGATGMVGVWTMALLAELSTRLSRPLRLLALARDPGKAVFAPGVTAVPGDVRDVDLAELGRLDAIVHAASPANPAAFADDPVGVVEANAFGAARLLAALRDTGGWFGLVSTMEVYGRVDRGASDEVLLDESAVGTVDSLDLRSAYPESKRLSETLCVAHAAQHGTRTDIARLSHTYGPGMPLTDSRVQAEFLRLALGGQPITLQSDGSLSRTYTYAADAAAAITWLLVTARDRSGADAFNVADEDSRTTIRGLAEAVLQAAGRDVADLTVAGAPGDPRLWSRAGGGTYLDCSKLRALGWSARWHLSDGLARTVAYHREAGR